MADSDYVTEQQRRNFMTMCENDPAFFAQNVVNDEFGDPYVLEPYQIQYLRCPALKKLLFWGRRLSKSLMIKLEVIHKSVFNRAWRSLVVSPTMEQAIYFGEDIQDLLSATPELDQLFLSKKSTKFKLNNQSRIYMATAGRGGASQLGKNALYLAFDETQIIPEETFVSLRPTLRGQKRDKTLVYAGTPLARLNEFYRAYDTAKFYITQDGAYKGTKGGPRDFVVFERPTCNVDKANEPISSSTNRISIEELKDDFRDMPLTGFLREYCLKWMDSIGEVFSQELMKHCVIWDDFLQDTSDKKCVAGLDIGKKRNSTVLTIGELTGGGVKTIQNIEWVQTKYTEIVEDILNMQPDFPNLEMLVIDETGVGKGVIEIFEEKLAPKWKGLDIVGFDFSGPKKKIDLVEGAVAELEQGMSHLTYHPKLISEMFDFKREITPQNNIRYQKPVGGSDDFVDSMLLCLFAGRDYYGYVDNEEHLETTGFNILSQRANKFARIPI